MGPWFSDEVAPVLPTTLLLDHLGARAEEWGIRRQEQEVLDIALVLIEQSTGTRVDIDAIPLDDEPTFELLRRGDSIGVFQLEGGPMRALMRSLAPRMRAMSTYARRI